jgi:soluble lytic murein transglycosylase-like protein
MASSDLLVQALMGSQMNQDPALAAALPRLQMAQALMQEGTNTAPVGSKWAGIGRVAQALLGGYMQNQSMSSIQDIVNQRNADTTNQMQYLRGGAPGGVAAPSPVPAPQASADVPTGGAGGSLPAEYLPYYQEASARTGIPVNVLIAQGKQESGFNPNATGGAGEIGLHQILPATAQSPGFGMAGVDPATLRDPRANINFAADYLKARGGPRTDFSNPANVEAALKNYNGGGDPNYVQHVMRYAGGVPVVSGGQGVAGRTGGTDVAGPAAPGAPGVNPNAQVQIPPPAGGQSGGPPGGAAPQQYSRQDALDMMNRARDVMANPRNQYNPALMKGAQAQMEIAKTILGLETYTQLPGGFQRSQSGKIESPAAPLPHFVQTPIGQFDTTGTHQGTYMPAPRPVTDVHGNTVGIGPGGQISPVATNPSGVTGNTPEANAMRIMAEIGPKMANGTATPQEVANYHVAVSAFQNPQNVSLAPGQTSTQITRPLPAGMPQPGAMPQQPQTAMPPSSAPVYGVPGPQPPIQGVTSTGPLPPSSAPPTQQPPNTVTNSILPSARAKIWENMANQDAQTVQKDQEKAAAGLPTLGTTATIRAMLPDVTTGKTADAKLLVSQWAAAAGMSPEQTEKYFGTNPVMGELLQKKLFELSTGAVRGMGAREPGSVISMFQRNYPQMGSRDMTIDAMTRLLDMDQIRNQDYASAKQQYHNESINTLSEDKGYRGLSGFDTQFDKTHNPRVYSAAALAAGGLPSQTWSKGLSPQQQADALRLAGRIYPDATVLDKNGVKHQLAGGDGG